MLMYFIDDRYANITFLMVLFFDILEPEGKHVNHKKLAEVVRGWWPEEISIGYSNQLSVDDMKIVIYHQKSIFPTDIAGL